MIRYPSDSSSDSDDGAVPVSRRPPSGFPRTASAAALARARTGAESATFRGVISHAPSTARPVSGPGMGTPAVPSDVPLHYTPALSRYGRATVDHAKRYRFDTSWHRPSNWDLVVEAHRTFHTNRQEYPSPERAAADAGATTGRPVVENDEPRSPRSPRRLGPSRAERAEQRRLSALMKKQAGAELLRRRNAHGRFQLVWHSPRNDDLRVTALRTYSLRDHDAPFVPAERKFHMRCDDELVQAAFEDADIAAEARRKGARPTTPRSVAQFFAAPARGDGVDDHAAREAAALDEMAALDAQHNAALRAAVTHASQQYWAGVGLAHRMFPTTHVTLTPRTASAVAARAAATSGRLADLPETVDAGVGGPPGAPPPGRPPRSRPTSARQQPPAPTPSNLTANMPRYAAAAGATAAAAAAPPSASTPATGPATPATACKAVPKPPSRPSSAKRPVSATARKPPPGAALVAKPAAVPAAVPDPTNPRDCHAWVSAVVPPAPGASA